ncbi:citrate/2-methylcitrate synthase [Helicobacter salomonis]|uniref:citrate/2-methylcitrate synthase n=1 Tax=Helicobacter salomonis TaxID=56878 RepID=UPI000CF16B93|nr:citrate/2-methylcitrate synthase [Helicobacter salomonis]
MEGLAGVVAGASAICSVGTGEGLLYRGYSIEELARRAEFEEVAHLLVVGHLPTEHELAHFKQALQVYRELPLIVKQVLQALPVSTHPMDVMKAGVVALGCAYPEELDFSNQDTCALRLLGALPSILIYWHNLHKLGKHAGLNSDKSMAHYLLEGLRTGTPLEEEVKAMDAMLTLYAEHEFNASTYANRITASTLSDLYSCVSTGINTLKGRLHGGANEVAIAFVLRFHSVQEALQEVDALFAKKEKIMGFGHRVYKKADPRSAVGFELAEQLKHLGDPKLFEIAIAIRDKVKQEKGLPDNIDFFGGLVYHYMRLERLYYTPFFVMSRAVGWMAHAFEQRAHNRIIRPTSTYTGASKRSFIPLQDR